MPVMSVSFLNDLALGRCRLYVAADAEEISSYSSSPFPNCLE